MVSAPTRAPGYHGPSRDHRPQRLRPPPHPLGVQPARRAGADHRPRRHVGQARLRQPSPSPTTARSTGRSRSTRPRPRQGIKPIIGVETYVARRSMRDKEGKADSQPFHLVLLATDMTGYQNLSRLLTDAHIDGYYYKPRIDREHLAKHSKGLVGPVGVPQRRDPQGARGRGLGPRAQAGRRVRGHLRQGPLLPRAPGPRPARTSAGSTSSCSAWRRRWACRSS